MDDNVIKIPAPWNLTGAGYIFIYKFKRKFIKEQGNIPEFLRDSFIGGLGSVMLVNYESSNAGGYGELLFIPGKFKYQKKKLNTISKIYVSTMESVINGRENWGIPKEKADFEFKEISKRKEQIIIKIGGDFAAEFVIKSRKLTFPVSTKLMPFPLIQNYNSKIYYTNFFGKGKGRFAKIKNIKINPKYFPDISMCKPIIVIRVDPFNITFPESEIFTQNKRR